MPNQRSPDRVQIAYRPHAALYAVLRAEADRTGGNVTAEITRRLVASLAADGLVRECPRCGIGIAVESGADWICTDCGWST